MSLISKCLDKLDKESYTETNILKDDQNFEALLKNHSKFNIFIHNLPFQEYLERFTTKNDDLNEELDSERKPKRQKNDLYNVLGEKDESERILRVLSNAIGDSEVMELLTKKFLDNFKNKNK